jgi:hypothetical protein
MVPRRLQAFPMKSVEFLKPMRIGQVEAAIQRAARKLS